MAKHTPHKSKNHPPADETSSGRVIGIMGDVGPTPVLRGVYSDVCKRSKISEPITACGQPSARRNHRRTLPQSAALTAPSEREPGRGAYHSSGYSLKSGVSGDFHRPYERAGSIHCSTRPFGVIQFSGVSKPWGFLDCQFQESRHMSARVSLASQWSTSRLLVGSA